MIPETTESQIAVHWKEEDYILPPPRFIGQAYLTDPTTVERFSEDAVWVNHTGTGLAGVYYGRSGVRDFFTIFKAAVDLERFHVDRIG